MLDAATQSLKPRIYLENANQKNTVPLSTSYTATSMNQYDSEVIIAYNVVLVKRRSHRYELRTPQMLKCLT